MPEEERLVQVDLLGQQFSFYTAESEDSMNRILEVVKTALGNDLETSKTSLAIAQRAILGCLTIASEHVKLTQKIVEEKKVEQARIEDLSEQINQILGDE